MCAQKCVNVCRSCCLSAAPIVCPCCCCQVPDGQAPAEYKAVATSQSNESDDSTDPPAASETPTQPDSTHPALTDSDKDQTQPSLDGGGPQENPAFTAENTDWSFRNYLSHTHWALNSVCCISAKIFILTSQFVSKMSLKLQMYNQLFWGNNSTFVYVVVFLGFSQYHHKKL